MKLLNTPLVKQFQQFEKEFSQIPESRKEILRQISSFVLERKKAGHVAFLNFICTHNSRRSHIAQLWAQAAAVYYGVQNVMCYSGGTEATAFNPRAVKAMSNVGFKIVKASDSSNPRYAVSFGDDFPTVMAFSKVYHDGFNPQKDFAAIMTCSHADENCPLVVGASRRISLPYNDPKDFDDTPQEALKYAERVLEIGREISFAFSVI
jgi:arsenate reductase